MVAVIAVGGVRRTKEKRQAALDHKRAGTYPQRTSPNKKAITMVANAVKIVRHKKIGTPIFHTKLTKVLTAFSFQFSFLQK